MNIDNNAGYMLHHLAFVLGRQSDQVLQERLGIGMSQLKIMMVLQWNASIQQKHIADKLGQTEASISRQIKLLLDQGLLGTTVNPQNRREHITTLTAKGLRFTEEALQVLNSYHAPTYEALDAKESQKLIELLQKLHIRACGGDRPGACHLTNMLDTD
jgi:DNA-binding MarR family transcriptional regulator